LVTPSSTAATQARCRVVAIVAAHNEVDVIAQVVGDLVAQGVEVYLLDHGSTDGTGDAVRPMLGRGLLAIEPFPDESGMAADEVARRPWESILRRKEQLAGSLDADWFIHHDADELREGLWPDLPLAEAIRRVDRAGFNAVDFAVLDFPPVDDSFQAGDDLRQAFPYCERSSTWNKVQIRCWKAPRGLVDLVSSGGHEAIFAGREVFPFRFLVRHYPIRSQAHGERKVLIERRPRLLAAERERGWHRQYDDIDEGHRYLRDPAELELFDVERVHLDLLLDNRWREALAGEPEVRRLADESLLRERDLLGVELDRRYRELDRCHRDLDLSYHQLERRNRELQRQRENLARRSRELAGARREIDGYKAGVESLRREIAELRTSLSWRLTAPLRRGLELLRGR
jgi:hypothetical protein